MIKFMGDQALSDILNEVIKTKKAPMDWNKEIIIPIFKKGDKRDCSNYRGVMLASIPGKIMAKITEKK